MNASASQNYLRHALAAALVFGTGAAVSDAYAQAPMAPANKVVAAANLAKAKATEENNEKLRETIRNIEDGTVVPASVRSVQQLHEDIAHPFNSSSPFPYVAIRQPVSDVLQAFRLGLGMPVLGNIDAETLVSVDGTEMTPREFLDAATGQAGLQWYFDGMSLHIVGTDRMKSRLIELGEVSIDELRESLDQLGLSDPRFEISVAPGANIAKVQGPEPFVEAVGSLLQTLRNRPPAVAIKPQPQPQPKVVEIERVASTLVDVPYAASQTFDAGPRVFRGHAR